MTHELLTVAEAASRLRISVATVYRLIAAIAAGAGAAAAGVAAEACSTSAATR